MTNVYFYKDNPQIVFNDAAERLHPSCQYEKRPYMASGLTTFTAGLPTTMDTMTKKSSCIFKLRVTLFKIHIYVYRLKYLKISRHSKMYIFPSFKNQTKFVLNLNSLQNAHDIVFARKLQFQHMCKVN